MLRRAAASEYLDAIWGVTRASATLAKYAVFGGGPGFYKAGRYPLYDPNELDRWAAEVLGAPVASTSEIPAAPRSLKPEHVQRSRLTEPDAGASPDKDPGTPLHAEPA